MRISDYTLNRLAVLKAIRRSGSVSRSELPGATGLSAGSITKLTSDLLARGLIVERKEVTKRAHRPRVLLEIAAGGAVVIGASIEGQGALTTVFVDLAGERLFAIEVPYGASATLGELAEFIAGAIETAIAASPFTASDIGRIGIGLPAVVDSERGNVHFVTTFPPGPVPFASRIEERLGIPVTIENDLACMARAEHWFGRAQGLDTFTMIHVGYSVGSAEYVDGLPRSGANGLNPEFGHVKTGFGSDAGPCICGARGCLLTFSSMYGILREAELLVDVPFPPVETIEARFDRFLDQADAGDPRALALLDRSATHLGIAIANHVNATDPGNVIVAVLGARFLAHIVERVRVVLDENTVPGVLPATNMHYLVADRDWRWTGTAALALEQAYLGET